MKLPIFGKRHQLKKTLTDQQEIALQALRAMRGASGSSRPLIARNVRTDPPIIIHPG